MEPPSKKKGAAAPRARSKVPAGRRVVVSFEDEAAGTGVTARRGDSDDELEGLFVSGDATLPAPLPGTDGSATQEATAIKAPLPGTGGPTAEEATAIKALFQGRLQSLAEGLPD